MPTTYENSPTEVMELLDRAKEKYHGELIDVNANIGCMFARNADGPAVKHGGYPAAATVRIRNLKDRTAGAPDAEILIDHAEWQSLSEDERFALLDHELHHLEPKVNRNGERVTDDLNRPKFVMRKHDHQFGWFDVIAKRHANASYEVKQAQAFADKHGQIYFGWAKPPDHGPEGMLAQAVADLPFGASDEKQPAPSATPEPWRSVIIADLKPTLSPSKLKALAEHNPPIVTMGDLSDLQEKHGQWWVKEIKGFGEKGQEQYIAATDALWKARPDLIPGAKMEKAALKNDDGFISDLITENPEPQSSGAETVPTAPADLTSARMAFSDTLKERLAFVKADQSLVNAANLFAVITGQSFIDDRARREFFDAASIEQLEVWTTSAKALTDASVRVAIGEPAHAGHVEIERMALAHEIINRLKLLDIEDSWNNETRLFAKLAGVASTEPRTLTRHMKASVSLERCVELREKLNVMPDAEIKALFVEQEVTA